VRSVPQRTECTNKNESGAEINKALGKPGPCLYNSLLDGKRCENNLRIDVCYIQVCRLENMLLLIQNEIGKYASLAPE
jgi:hypothetical protein